MHKNSNLIKYPERNEAIIIRLPNDVRVKIVIWLIGNEVVCKFIVWIEIRRTDRNEHDLVNWHF